jgi:hypothetical protein
MSAAPKKSEIWGPRPDARQSGAPQNASLSDPSVQQAPPSSPLLVTNPGDLVARALAILAEEDEAWQARRGLNFAPRSVR